MTQGGERWPVLPLARRRHLAASNAARTREFERGYADPALLLKAGLCGGRRGCDTSVVRCPVGPHPAFSGVPLLRRATRSNGYLWPRSALMCSQKQPPCRPVPDDPHQHAMKIAEAVDETWHREHGSGNLEVPVSVIGALAFMAPPEQDHSRTVDQLLSLAADEFADFICVQWRIFIGARPDLVNRAWPLISVWLGERRLGQREASAAKSVADAALRAGQLRLTGTERRRETDLFGVLLEVVRSRSAKRARGQFYTPPCVADVMARLAGVPGEGERVLEPTAGTGGLFRSAAEAMRQLGRDPSTVEWWAVDVDELAMACLTVNAVLWGLGNKVVLGVGNGLTDEWIPRALGERRETLGLATAVRSVTRLELLLRDARQHPDG